MRKTLNFSTALLIAVLFTITVWSQQVKLNGSVKNAATQVVVPAVSVVVKNTGNGTFTDDNGRFEITVTKLPAVLIFSSVGFETKEVPVSDNAAVQVDLTPGASLGQEVVVS